MSDSEDKLVKKLKREYQNEDAQRALVSSIESLEGLIKMGIGTEVSTPFVWEDSVYLVSVKLHKRLQDE